MFHIDQLHKYINISLGLQLVLSEQFLHLFFGGGSLVKNFIHTALQGCSVPRTVKHFSLEHGANNFFDYIHNITSIHDLPTGFSNGSIKRPWAPLDTEVRIKDDEPNSVRRANTASADQSVGIQPFPMWPPDLFAIAATLLERSGAYLLIRPKISTLSVDSIADADGRGEIDWFGSLNSKEFFDNDPFQISGANQIILRLIGHIWAQGAFISTPDKKMTESNYFTFDRIIDQYFTTFRITAQCLENYPDRHPDGLSKETFDSFKKLLFSNFKAPKSLPHLTGQPYFQELTVSLQNADVKAFETIRPTSFSSTDIFPDNGDRRLYSAYIHSCITSCEAFQLYKFNETQIKKIAELRPLSPFASATLIWAADYIQRLWKTLIESECSLAVFDHSADLKTSFFNKPDHFRWWQAAIKLLIIADEASAGMGFSAKPRSVSSGERSIVPGQDKRTEIGENIVARTPLIWDYFNHAYSQNVVDSNKRTSSEVDASKKYLDERFPRTLTRCFDDELGAVLPKSRTTQLGCTLRSMSHNLALMPPRGRLRARWARLASKDVSNAMNVLLIPLPYKLHTRDFVSSLPLPDVTAPLGAGSFSVYPSWLYPRLEEPIEQTSSITENGDFLDFFGIGTQKGQKPFSVPIQPLSTFPNASAEQKSIYQKHVAEPAERYHERLLKFIENVISDVNPEDIDGIIFPEASLSYDALDYLLEHLPKVLPRIEILIAGLMSAPSDLNMTTDKATTPDQTKRIHGNFVATCLRVGTNRSQAGAQNKASWKIRHIRGKHHRWKLEKRQLREYALSSTLSPQIHWWEDFDILPREMLFAEFSRGSVLTSLICEDLARIEPCQVALRAIGPNLIFVLLMDGAQISGRWPHMYAGVLADDPGSSVLTLTSFGLVERSMQSANRSSRSIALWREPGGDSVSIDLPKGYLAQLVTLQAERVKEVTLDMRSDHGSSAYAWRFAGTKPLRGRVDGGKSDAVFPEMPD